MDRTSLSCRWSLISGFSRQGTVAAVAAQVQPTACFGAEPCWRLFQEHKYTLSLLTWEKGETSSMSTFWRLFINQAGDPVLCWSSCWVRYWVRVFYYVWALSSTPSEHLKGKSYKLQLKLYLSFYFDIYTLCFVDSFSAKPTDVTTYNYIWGMNVPSMPSFFSHLDSPPPQRAFIISVSARTVGWSAHGVLAKEGWGRS